MGNWSSSKKKKEAAAAAASPAFVPKYPPGSSVSCYAGKGTVLSTSSPFRCEVLLTNWELAYGSKVTCYVHEDQVSLLPTIAIGQFVRCYAGVGEVIEATSSTRIAVRLTNWELAYKSKVICYMAEEQLTVVPGPILTNISVGQYVKCYAGVGIVKEVSSADRIEVLLTNWELAYESKVTCYMAESQLTVVDEPGVVAKYPEGTRVDTPFGKGVVVTARVADYVVQIDSNKWELAYGQRPTLYLAEDMLTAETEKSRKAAWGGDAVQTPFGDGFVLSTAGNGQKVVESGEWKLANKCLPRMFLDESLCVKSKV